MLFDLWAPEQPQRVWDRARSWVQPRTKPEPEPEPEPEHTPEDTTEGTAEEPQEIRPRKKDTGLVLEAHWGLFRWEGPAHQYAPPEGLISWLSLGPPIRQGCADSIESALAWATGEVASMWDRIAGWDADASVDRVVQDLGEALRRGQDRVLEKDLAKGDRWVMGVVASPLCLSPQACRKEAALPDANRHAKG